MKFDLSRLAVRLYALLSSPLTVRFAMALLVALFISGMTTNIYAAEWLSWSQIYATGNDPWYSNWFYTTLSYGGEWFCYAIDATTNYQCTYR